MRPWLLVALLGACDLFEEGLSDDAPTYEAFVSGWCSRYEECVDAPTSADLCRDLYADLPPCTYDPEAGGACLAFLDEVGCEFFYRGDQGACGDVCEP